MGAYDFHVHTSFSFDCSSDPERVVETALKKGLQGIAITDHDTVEGGIACREVAGDSLVVVPGIEVDTEAGDMIGLFVEKEDGLLTTDPFGFASAVHAQGGLVMLPHPFRVLRYLEEGLAERIDVIEGYNGRTSRGPVRDPQYGDRRVRAWAERYEMAVVAGSDAHTCGEIGSVQTIVPAGSADEVRRAIERRNTLVAGRPRTPLGRLWSDLNRWTRIGWIRLSGRRRGLSGGSRS